MQTQFYDVKSRYFTPLLCILSPVFLGVFLGINLGSLAQAQESKLPPTTGTGQMSAGAKGADNLTPGTYRCYKPSDYDAASGVIRPSESEKYVRGFCKYQAYPFGDEIFTKLLRLSRLQVKDWIAGIGFSRDNLEPTQGPGDFTIIWWFDDPQSNIRMGELLRANDGLTTVFRAPQVKITASLYSFNKGYDRELGFNVGAFFGNNSGSLSTQNSSVNAAPGTTPTVTPINSPVSGTTLGNGIFNSVMQLGNPLASYLTLGIDAAYNSQKAERVTEVVYSCELGSPCDYSHQRANYFVYSLGTKDDSIGLLINTRPMLDPANPSLVRLQMLNFRYSIPTENATAPVDVYQPFNGGRDVVFQTDQLYVLGSESTRVDVRTGKLVAVGSQNAHTQFLILMTVSVFHPENANIQLPDYVVGPQFQTQNDDRSFSDEEKAKLPNGQLSLKEVLSSIEMVCFKDVLNPTNSTKICGFKFTKLDQKYINYRLKVKIDGDLRYENQRVQFWKIGDLYNGKGYYQVPLTPSDPLHKPNSYRLHFELDDSNGVAQKMKKSEKVQGIEFPFGYYPDSSDPILYSSKLIKFKKRGFHL